LAGLPGVRPPSRYRAAVRRLDGKRAIVTGASSGIGLATAQAFAALGARVAVGARRFERLPVGDAFVRLPLDVLDRASCERFVTEAVAGLGGLDILFNNAGLALGRGPFDDSSEEDEQLVLDTNVRSAMRLTRLCLPHIRDGGHIVFMGSVAGRQAYEGGASYIASKFAVRGFCYALREDLLGRPIRITTVDAGAVETEFSVVRYRGDQAKADAVYKGIDPLTAEDIADCVAFAVTRPAHVNVDEIVVKALQQSSGARFVRRESES
jgi:3-hydroxy acid dehydrogenase/malonic semialdehyde reductase